MSMHRASEFFGFSISYTILNLPLSILYLPFISLFLKIFRGERETSMCDCLIRAPYWGHGLQPRHVPWMGIERATLWLACWHSSHWATPARAYLYLLIPVPFPHFPLTPLITFNVTSISVILFLFLLFAKFVICIELLMCIATLMFIFFIFFFFLDESL